MKPVHNSNCVNAMLVVDMMTEQYADSHITSIGLQKILNKTKPCGACCSALFREQSRLSGRIYRPQVERVLAQFSKETDA